MNGWLCRHAGRCPQLQKISILLLCQRMSIFAKQPCALVRPHAKTDRPPGDGAPAVIHGHRRSCGRRACAAPRPRHAGRLLAGQHAAMRTRLAAA